MGFLEHSSQGVFNGVTEVTLLAAPSSGNVRVIKAVRIYNADTVALTITISKRVSAGATSGTNYFVLFSGSLQPGETLEIGTVVLEYASAGYNCLVGTSTAITTNQAQYNVEYAEIIP